MNDIETLIVDSNNLSTSILVLSKLSYEKIQLDSMKIEDINELNAIIATIQCLADKHAKDMETLERIA